MKITYFPETDTLYVDISSKPAAESDEVAEGVVLDYDDAGHLAGIEIEHASARADLSELVVKHFPGETNRLSA